MSQATASIIRVPAPTAMSPPVSPVRAECRNPSPNARYVRPTSNSPDRSTAPPLGNKLIQQIEQRCLIGTFGDPTFPPGCGAEGRVCRRTDRHCADRFAGSPEGGRSGEISEDSRGARRKEQGEIDFAVAQRLTRGTTQRRDRPGLIKLDALDSKPARAKLANYIASDIFAADMQQPPVPGPQP